MSNKHTEKRIQLREELWPGEAALDISKGVNGWFMAFRTLPLILALIREKSVCGGGSKGDARMVYFELLSHHMGGGLIELGNENDHAYAAGYRGERAATCWRERIELLENAGFIKIKRIGARFKYVLLVHPTIAVQRLRDAGKVPEEWWQVYRARQVETTEPRYEDLVSVKVTEPIPIRPPKKAKQAG